MTYFLEFVYAWNSLILRISGINIKILYVNNDYENPINKFLDFYIFHDCDINYLKIFQSSQNPNLTYFNDILYHYSWRKWFKTDNTYLMYKLCSNWKQLRARIKNYKIPFLKFQTNWLRMKVFNDLKPGYDVKLSVNGKNYC